MDQIHEEQMIKAALGALARKPVITRQQESILASIATGAATDVSKAAGSYLADKVIKKLAKRKGKKKQKVQEHRLYEAGMMRAALGALKNVAREKFKKSFERGAPKGGQHSQSNVKAGVQSIKKLGSSLSGPTNRVM